MTKREFHIQCRACESVLPYVELISTCPQCGHGWLDAVYDFSGLFTDKEERPFTDYGANLWRYRQLLPIRCNDNIVTLGEGWTPLVHAHNLGRMLGYPRLYIKDERQGPTGSFKDRQAAVAISLMKEAGITEAVVSSVGNVAIAYAAYAARAGIKLWVFVPDATPAEKIRKTAVYGATIIKVPDTYDQTKMVAAQFARDNNLFLDRGIKGIAAKEAMKTIAFEIAEQLGNVAAGDEPSHPYSPHPWQAPGWYLQSVSGGLGPVGVMKGFWELNALGLVGESPKLGCFQTVGCAPMVDAFQKKQSVVEIVENPATDIITLTTGKPGEAYEVLFELMLQHGGAMERVSDLEAYQALQLLAKTDGISVEPATAVTFAGLIKLIQQGVIHPDETVVINASGHTLSVSEQVGGTFDIRDMVTSFVNHDNGNESAASHARSRNLIAGLSSGRNRGSSGLRLGGQAKAGEHQNGRDQLAQKQIRAIS